MCVCLSVPLCLTLCNPMDCSPSGSSVHGILQARMLEWVAICYSRGSSWPRAWTHVSYVSCIGRQILYHCITWEALTSLLLQIFFFSLRRNIKLLCVMDLEPPGGNELYTLAWEIPQKTSVCQFGWVLLHVEWVVKNTSANAGEGRDAGSIPESGRSPRGGHGDPL